MPGSVSSASSISTSRMDTSSYRHHGSSLHSQHSRRSPSPTEHYRERHENTHRLEERLYDLTRFIHTGIDKFLDKQAVRDLLKTYDDETDLIEDELLEALTFGRVDSTESDGIPTQFGEDILTVVQDKDRTLITMEQEVLNKLNAHRNDRHRQKVQSQHLAKGLIATFLAIIRVKLFNVRRNNASKHRRENEGNDIFSDAVENVTCFCF